MHLSRSYKHKSKQRKGFEHTTKRHTNNCCYKIEAIKKLLNENRTFLESIFDQLITLCRLLTVYHLIFSVVVKFIQKRLKITETMSAGNHKKVCGVLGHVPISLVRLLDIENECETSSRLYFSK